MLRHVTGDIFDVTTGIIAHQVNCRGVMGAGIAREIARRFPKAESDYKARCARNRHYDPDGHPASLLGKVEMSLVRPFNTTTPESGLFIANVFGQIHPRFGPRQTNYGAVADAFESLRFHTDIPLYVPWGMGCGLAGGDWTVYSEIIEHFRPDATVVQRPGTTSEPTTGRRRDG